MLAPENTLAAFGKALEAGAGSIETDLSLLACGRLAVFHDATLGRTAPGKEALANLTADDIAGLDAGNGEKIPLLEDALAFQKKTQMRFNWEIKCHEKENATASVAAMARALDEESINLSVISSFSREVLAAARDSIPSLRRALVAYHLPPDWQEATGELGLTALHLNDRNITAEVVEEIKTHERGLRISSFTVNDLAAAKRLVGMGVDTIITDCPESLLA